MSEEHNGKRTVTVTIKCQSSGYGFDLVAADISVGTIPVLIDRLVELDIQAAFTPYAGTMAGNGAADDDTPRCPVHGSPMKESQKNGGGWFCSRKNADGSYCKEVAKD